MFQIVWKISVQSGKFPDSLEVSGQCEKFPVMYARVYMACKQKQFMHFWHIYDAKAISALLAHFCRKNDLCALSRKFLRMKFCRPESLDFLCLCNKAHTLVQGY